MTYSIPRSKIVISQALEDESIFNQYPHDQVQYIQMKDDNYAVVDVMLTRIANPDVIIARKIISRDYLLGNILLRKSHWLEWARRTTDSEGATTEFLVDRADEASGYKVDRPYTPIQPWHYEYNSHRRNWKRGYRKVGILASIFTPVTSQSRPEWLIGVVEHDLLRRVFEAEALLCQAIYDAVQAKPPLEEVGDPTGAQQPHGHGDQEGTI